MVAYLVGYIIIMHCKSLAVPCTTESDVDVKVFSRPIENT